ncbi:hypothetical protein MASR2M70_07630 [Bacillota bacterium]
MKIETLAEIAKKLGKQEKTWEKPGTLSIITGKIIRASRLKKKRD